MVAILALASALSIFSASADVITPPNIRVTPIGIRHPMIEIGAAARVSSNTPGMDVLLSASWRGIRGASEDQYWAHVTAEGAFNPVTGEVPTFNIEITPYQKTGSAGVLPLAWQMEVLPIAAERDIRMGNDASVTVRALKVGGGFYIPPTEEGTIAFTLAVAVEALGAQYEKFTGDGGSFVGGRVGGVSVELGGGYKFTERLVLRAALGVGGDLALGSSNGNFSVHTSNQAYARISLDLDRTFEFFLQGTYRHTNDSGSGREQSLFEAMAGLRIITN